MFTHYHSAFRYLEGILSNLPRQKDYMKDKENPEVFLKRTRYFLNLLGNPDKDIKFIHITGTAGKGSVSTHIQEILKKSGKNVGLFTSPFVQTAIEKIKVNDLYISPDEFVKILESLKPLIDRSYQHGPYGSPSYFELFFIIALIHFKKMKCEWVVLEVGLGGRYDCTNVIEHPVITAITNVNYDHTEILGDTLEKIAHDKAGIIKAGSIFLTSEQRPQILNIFKRECELQKAFFRPVLEGHTYKEQNNNLVSAIAHSIGIHSCSLENIQLPCRFEVIQKNPFVVLDGAHNPIKLQTVVKNINTLKYKKLYLIVGMADHKDIQESLKDITHKADHVFITRFQNPLRKCVPPLEIRAVVDPKKDVKIFLDPHMALDEAIVRATKDDLIVVTGSFFLAGELREQWIPEEYILSARKSF